MLSSLVSRKECQINSRSEFELRLLLQLRDFRMGQALVVQVEVQREFAHSPLFTAYTSGKDFPAVRSELESDNRQISW